MKLKALLLGIGLVSCALTDSASADVILGNQTWFTSGAQNLFLSTAQPPGNQPQNVQCIICGEHQPGSQILGYNDYHNSGNQGDVFMFSTAVLPGGGGSGLNNDQIGTAYGPGVLSAFYGANATFSIGIDVNDTNVAQRLNSFYVLDLTTHNVLAAYQSPFDAGTPVPSFHNGTGYPDYTLGSFQLTGAAAGHDILFFARISGANDGPDSFFLVADTTAAVPEASTWAMLLAGFAGIGGIAMRRNRKERLLRLA
jgi:hypothetical protein